MKLPRILIFCILLIILIIFTTSCANKNNNLETYIGTGNTTATSSDSESNTYTTIEFEDVMGVDYSLMYENPEAQTALHGNSVQNQNHPIVHSYKIRSDIKLVTILGGSKNDMQLHINVNQFVPDGNFVIGYHGSWNALPRLPKRIGNGIYELDIDNDGSNEIITVEFVSNNRDIVRSRLYVESMNDKILVTEMEIMEEYLDTYTLYTLDLNGDGKMELIQFAFGFLEKPEVFEMKGSSFQKVF